MRGCCTESYTQAEFVKCWRQRSVSLLIDDLAPLHGCGGVLPLDAPTWPLQKSGSKGRGHNGCNARLIVSTNALMFPLLEMKVSSRFLEPFATNADSSDRIKRSTDRNDHKDIEITTRISTQLRH